MYIVKVKKKHKQKKNIEWFMRYLQTLPICTHIGKTSSIPFSDWR